MNIGVLSVLLLITSCFFTPSSIKQIFSEPKFKNQKANLNLLISNGLSGKLAPQESIKSSKINFKDIPSLLIGGEKALYSYFKIAKERYKDSVLLLDSGDLFKTGSSEIEIQKVISLYKKIGFDAVALSRRDIKELSPFVGEKNFEIPFLLSNVVDIKKMRPLKKNGVIPYKIINKGPFKIGIINITSMKRFRPGLYMEDPILTIIKIKKVFRKKKVDITILMADFDSKCISTLIQIPKAFKDFKKHQLKCPPNDPLYTFIKRIPPTSVDLILTNNKIQAQGFLKNIPIIQTSGEGKYLARVRLNLEPQSKKLDLKRSFILPPILTCNSFFNSTKDCYLGEGETYFSKENARIEIIRKSSYKKIPATYLGKTIPVSDNLVTN